MKTFLRTACAVALATQACSAALANTYVVDTFSSSIQHVERNFSATELGAFTDHYTFTLSQTSLLTGTLGDNSQPNYDFVSLSLMSLGSASNALVSGVNSFSFDSLVAGTYDLIVTGTVAAKQTGPDTFSTKGQYNIGLQFSPSTSAVMAAGVASAAPEASDFAMSLTGLGFVALMLRRRKARLTQAA